MVNDLPKPENNAHVEAENTNAPTEVFTTFSQTETPNRKHVKLKDQEERLFLLDLTDGTIGRLNALHLLTVLKNFPYVIKWNIHGHLSYFQNRFDPRTNIRKLMKYLFKQTQQTVPPGLTRLFRAMAY